MVDDDDRTHPDPPPRRRRRGPSERVPEADTFIGQLVFDRYRVEAQIGAGAMGTVYRGSDVTAERSVAIKVLHDHLVDEPNMLTRFRREAQNAARLAHPNVISLFDCGRTADGREVMVFEFVDGPRLTELIEIIPARRRVIRLIDQILLGLEHAHLAGLIHRDLKPDNVVVELAHDGTELPRIIDFGIAILRSPENPHEAQRLTASGIMIGTPMYMAPEQAQLDPYDHRVDLFALGVILYEMLAGVPPFEGSALEIAVAYIRNDPPTIAARAPERQVDALLEQFARKLMARRPDDRFTSATEAREVLALLDTDPDLAKVKLGQSDLAKATAVVSLPSIPGKKKR